MSSLDCVTPPSTTLPIRSAERISLWNYVILHLLPGMLAAKAYALIARPVEALGFPSIMPWLMAVMLVLLPFELGIMLLEGKKRNGRWSLDGVVLYHKPLSAAQIILWTAITFFAALILYILSGPLTTLLQTQVFGWVPDWLVMDTGLEGGGFSKSALLIVNFASVLVFIIGVPVVEEMYFRGFLLPRLAHLGIWAVVLNSFLFALYHFTTPWMLAARFLYALPLAYTAYRKQSLVPSILTHAMANSVDVIMGFAYIIGMG